MAIRYAAICLLSKQETQEEQQEDAKTEAAVVNEASAETRRPAEREETKKLSHIRRMRLKMRNYDVRL